MPRRNFLASLLAALGGLLLPRAATAATAPAPTPLPTPIPPSGPCFTYRGVTLRCPCLQELSVTNRLTDRWHTIKDIRLRITGVIETDEPEAVRQQLLQPEGVAAYEGFRYLTVAMQQAEPTAVFVQQIQGSKLCLVDLTAVGSEQIFQQ